MDCNASLGQLYAERMARAWNNRVPTKYHVAGGMGELLKIMEVPGMTIGSHVWREASLALIEWLGTTDLGSSGERWLEVGSGTGIVSIAIAKMMMTRSDGVTITASDCENIG